MRVTNVDVPLRLSLGVVVNQPDDVDGERIATNIFSPHDSRGPDLHSEHRTVRCGSSSLHVLWHVGLSQKLAWRGDRCAGSSPGSTSGKEKEGSELGRRRWGYEAVARKAGSTLKVVCVGAGVLVRRSGLYTPGEGGWPCGGSCLQQGHPLGVLTARLEGSPRAGLGSTHHPSAVLIPLLGHPPLLDLSLCKCSHAVFQFPTTLAFSSRNR